MLAGKHVFLEKPIALELWEAQELIDLARSKGLRFTIGYSQRFNPKFALVKRSIDDGTIGQPISALVSRHITRNLGKKIGGRVKLSPAAMEATHDIDFVLWCLAPRKPVKVYAQEVRKIMGAQYDVPDCVWMIVTMDDGTAFTIGAGWVLPPAYPNFSSTWIEMVGTEGAIMVDDTHRDVYVTTMQKGIQFPISTMPGEKVAHVYAGPMEAETNHFLECIALDREPLVTAEHAKMVMQVYQAADQSAETGQPVELAAERVPSLA
jgi:scyllo-inositol 2-dehydrogenase (NAD+)